MTHHCYEVTQGCNSHIKHWRGELRGYEVTRVTRMHMHAGGQAGACVRAHACTCVSRVTAQPRNSLGVARLSRLRVRATA